MTAECIRKIESGELTDCAISVEMLDHLTFPGRYQIYFPAVVVGDDYSNPAAYRYIRDSIRQSIRDFATDGVFFEKMVAISASLQGKNLCAKPGMTPVCNHPTEIGSVLFSLDGKNVARSYFGKDRLVRELYLKEFG